MSLTLQPQNYFTIVRQLENPFITDAHFVQAVIRNAFTDAIIDTVNLTDKGSNRFKVDWKVPADPSGQGFYVSIITSVYSDSGFTTKDQNYGDQENTYLVQERVLNSLRGSGGNLDMATHRRIIAEELGKQEKPEKIDYERIPKPKEISDRTDEIIRAIKENKPEKAEPTDLSPVHTLLAEIKRAIADKEVTPETDLQPILDRLAEAKDDSDVTADEMKTLLDQLKEELTGLILKSVQEAINKANFVTTFITHAAQGPAPKSPETKPQMEDIKRLAI